MCFPSFPFLSSARVTGTDVFLPLAPSLNLTSRGGLSRLKLRLFATTQERLSAWNIICGGKIDGPETFSRVSLHSLLHLRAIYPDLHDITVLQHDSGDSASNQCSRIIFTSVGIAVGLKAEKIPHGWIVGRDNTMWLECGWADDETDRH